MITQDLMTNGLGQNFEEYFATASVQAPPGDPRPVFYLSQGPPPFQFNIAPDGYLFLGHSETIAAAAHGLQHAGPAAYRRAAAPNNSAKD